MPISASAQRWLTDHKMDHMIRDARIASKYDLTNNQWIKIKQWFKDYPKAAAIYQEIPDEDLALEVISAIASADGCRPISPQIIRNSVSVMAILKGPICSPAGTKRKQ